MRPTRLAGPGSATGRSPRVCKAPTSRERTSSAPSSAGRSRCRSSTCTPNLPPASASAGSRASPTPPWDFTPTINSPENVEALAFYKSLYDLSPPESINYVWFDAGTRFSQKDIGMFYWWTPYFYLTKNDGYMTGTPSGLEEVLGYGVLPKAERRCRADHQPGRLESRHPQLLGQPGRGLAVHQVGDRRRSAEEDGPGAGLQLPVQRLLPGLALHRPGDRRRSTRISTCSSVSCDRATARWSVRRRPATPRWKGYTACSSTRR